MGLVFQAEDQQLQRGVALKVMRPDLAKNESARQRFLREARATAAVRSDHIVTIFQVGEHQDIPFLAMELLQGEPLDDWLRRERHPSVKQVLQIALQIARGLEAAHECELIHRDIKPENIWIEAGTERVKILDFGLARPARDDTHLTQTGLIMGTPAYMAPEQADGEAVDARSDLFSLGCVLYELATGHTAFWGSTTMSVLKAILLNNPRPPLELNPSMPPALAGLVTQLLEKKPENRPPSAGAVARTLADIAANPSTPPGPPAGTPPTREASRPAAVPPRPQTTKTLLVIGGLAVLASVLLLTTLLRGWLFQHSPDDGKSPAHANRVTAQGVTEDKIVLGMSAPFSGPSRELGRQMKLGMETYFRDCNEQGGIGGRQIQLEALDDGYEPDRALANMRELNEQRKVFAFIGNVGTPTTAKALPYALERRIPFFGAFTGAKHLRKDPPDRYVFNYRASYAEETAATLRYLVEIKRVRPEQVAVFAQDDSYGDAGFQGVAGALRKLGGDPDKILRVGYTRNTAEVGEAVQKILQHKDIRAVIMVATYRAAARFIQKLRDAKFEGILTNVSFVGSEALAEELKELGPQYGAGVIVTQVVPPIDSQATEVLKYRECLKKYFPSEQPSFGSLEGYLVAAIFAEGLRRAGENLTPETLVEALESIHDLDIGIGASINFAPSEHQASHKVWATVLEASGHYRILEMD
jgi:ABC-type branched-subunit amino acid transport system substrate-binding protein